MLDKGFYPEHVQAYPAPPQVGGSLVLLRFIGDIEEAVARYNQSEPPIELGIGANQCAYSGFQAAEASRPLLFVGVHKVEGSGLLAIVSPDSKEIAATLEHFMDQNKGVIRVTPVTELIFPFSLG